MKNLPFVIWMLGYPLVVAIDGYLVKSNDVYTDDVEAFSALITVAIWFIVGKLLYGGKPT